MPDSFPPLDTTLAEFRASIGAETPAALRKAFHAREDLVAEAITFCESRGVTDSNARIVSRLLGVGPHGFHHLEPNLAGAFQADMPSLAHMIEREARATYAAHTEGQRETLFVPLPAYLHHQRQHFSLEAVECRNGQWRFLHLTTLRQHLVDLLEGQLVTQAAECIPRARNRTALDRARVELQRVASAASEDEVHRHLVLYGKRLAHSLIDEVLSDLSAIPGRVGVSPPGPDDFGFPGEPAGTWTLALVHPGDADKIRCADIEDSLSQLGTFPLCEWTEAVLQRVTREAGAHLAQEVDRLRTSLHAMQGPPVPRRMIINESMADLFDESAEEIQRQCRAVAEADKRDPGLQDFLDDALRDDGPDNRGD